MLASIDPRRTKYMPRLHPKQLAFLMLPHREAMYGGAGGGGKALTVDTPIPTPRGWTTMGEVEKGDLVFSEKGLPCQVTSKSDVLVGHNLYRVSFDDGSEIVADAEHQWLTFTINERAQLARLTDDYRARRRGRRENRGVGKRPDLAQANRVRPYQYLSAPTGGIRTTTELFKTVRHNGRINHSVPVAAPLQLPESRLPIDPYVLGLWLGDGTSRSGQFTTADDEIIRAFDMAGLQPHPLAGKYQYGTYGLATALRKAAVLGAKHIPDPYLRASESQRRALLMGLMDTDGDCAADGGATFTSTNEALAMGAFELAASLGLKPSLSKGLAKLNGRVISPVWDVRFTTSTPVFRLPRKAARQPVVERGVQRWRYILKVEPVVSQPVQCIAVDSPSKMYLAGRAMIPTHNSVALLAGALQYVDIPGYGALIIRKTYPQLSQSSGLIPRSHDWLASTDAKWSEQERIWTFPSGATLKFGHMEHRNSMYQYQGAEYQYVAYDELTAFEEMSYRFLFGWLRKPTAGPLSHVPLRMRAASNPGGIGHDWVKRYFVDAGPSPERFFLPAKAQDNPSLDLPSYMESLSYLDPITRAQIMNGDWTARHGGSKFRREWFDIVDIAPPESRFVRFWDLAATFPEEGEDPDWTAGVKVGLHRNGSFYIADVVRFRETPHVVEAKIARTAQLDGTGCAVRMEQEPGASGVNTIDHYARTVLLGYDFRGVRTSGAKEERANPVSAAAERRQIKLVTANWTTAFLDEIEAFPLGSHDDQVDALSGAFQELALSTQNLLKYVR